MSKHSRIKLWSYRYGWDEFCVDLQRFGQFANNPVLCRMHDYVWELHALTDALMEEHEAVGNDRGECFMPGGKGGCDYCQYTDTCAAHDKVERVMKGEG